MGMTQGEPSLTKRLAELERRVRQLEWLIAPTKDSMDPASLPSLAAVQRERAR
jgi:hypothetical protein